jgi:conjugative transfer signal peptidase TraF
VQLAARYAPAGRALVVACAGLIASAALAVAVSTICRRLTLNVTPSLPLGVYVLRPGRPPIRGELVDFVVPASIAPLIATRGYLPASYHLLKRLVGVAGDHVCIDDEAVVVEERIISRIARTDTQGRPLPPVRRMCGAVPEGLAIVAAPPPTSLDSRFFGPVPLARLTVATPLWTSSSR